MKPRKPLLRKTPLRANPETTRAWKDRSRQTLPARSPRRKKQERDYSSERDAFLEAHPYCPITGKRTTEIHHSAGREGAWLNLKRYWIAMSHRGHSVVTANGKWAESVGLVVRVNPVYNWHVEQLVKDGVSLEEPVFYKNWDGKQIPLPNNLNYT